MMPKTLPLYVYPMDDGDARVFIFRSTDELPALLLDALREAERGSTSEELRDECARYAVPVELAADLIPADGCYADSADLVRSLAETARRLGRIPVGTETELGRSLVEHVSAQLAQEAAA